ncbi:MAG: NAD(+) diphosphatase [Kiritimatiellia bacterium]
MDPADATYVFCDSLLLVKAGGLEPAGAEALADLAPSRAVLDDFSVRPQGCRAVGLAGAAEDPPPGHEWARVRALIAAQSPHAAAACRALGLIHWRAAHRFCGACGGTMEEHPAEMARKCGACGRVEYPGIAPAVIVRVEKEGNILLARHVQRIPDLWTCLAGYVELGESLEDCVRREVKEEAGIEVDGVRYAGSQHWPYPNQLMVAFKARWKSGELKLQAEELSEARWFDPAELPKIPPPGSMAYRLIHGLV